MDYLITFSGHLDPKASHPNLPAVIQDILYITADSEQGVVTAANDRLGHYIRLQGMAVSIDPNGVQTLLSPRRWVPMSRITHIDIKVQLAQAPPPSPGSPEMGWTV